MKHNWEDIATTSHYLTVKEIKYAMEENNLNEVELGLVELLNSIERADKRALLYQLERLMIHIIKWEIQPEKRSRSWALTILHARYEIEDIREETPSLTRKYIESIWDKSFNHAKDVAEAETETKTVEVKRFTWKDVFEKEYQLPFNK